MIAIASCHFKGGLTVGNLQIPIVQIPRKAPFSVDEGIEASKIRNVEAAITTLQHIQVVGSLTSVHQDFLFQGTVTGTFEGQCDRCIEPAKTIETVEVSWLFEPGTVTDAMEDLAQSEDSDEEEYTETEEVDQIRFYEGDELDLTPHAWEEMVLASPFKIYCTETCKGLCPHCGVNLNKTTCECTEETEQNNSGMQALKDLYPDLPSNTSEE